jgi:tetratricopeptide (TPR) repeat protein
LGNFWYAHRRYTEAIATWEQARALDDQFPTVHRNLGLAYFNKLSLPQLATKSLERAFVLNPSDARVLFELDQLYKKLNRLPAERLAFLEQHEDLVEQRDDLTIERINLLNLLHRPEDAIELLMKRNFHPWEGGEGKVTRQYVLSLVEIARKCIERGEFETAINYLQEAQTYPPNLGEGKLFGAQENNIFYYLACAYQGQGKTARARAWYERATLGSSEPTSAIFYNDQPPDMIFYQGLAQQKLGETDAGQAIFQKMVDYGRSHMNDDIKIDYFAISLPNFLVFEEDLNQRNQIHCHYMIALGYLGLRKFATAQIHFDKVLQLDANHLDAVLHRQLLRQEHSYWPHDAHGQ